MMMHTDYQFHWEVVAMDEMEPFYIFTETDSVAAAAIKFEETWGDTVSIKYIRKTAVTRLLPDELDLEDEVKVYQQK